jgi:hypothetical protein
LTLTFLIFSTLAAYCVKDGVVDWAKQIEPVAPKSAISRTILILIFPFPMDDLSINGHAF